jgi:hypothetical protein
LKAAAQSGGGFFIFTGAFFSAMIKEKRVCEMERFARSVESYQQRMARYKALSAELPGQIDRARELESNLPSLRLAVEQAKWEMEQAENPGFFRRLFNRPEDLQRKARTAYRDAVTALDKGKAEAERANATLAALNAECAELAGCREAYYRFLQEHLDVVPDARNLLNRQLAQDAIAASRGMSDLLEQLRPGMQHDVRFVHVAPGDRKMAILEAADLSAQVFLEWMAQLPEGIVTIGASLSCPSAYITGASMEAAQLDRLNIVLDQAGNAREKLREYIAKLS